MDSTEREELFKACFSKLVQKVKANADGMQTRFLCDVPGAIAAVYCEVAVLMMLEVSTAEGAARYLRSVADELDAHRPLESLPLN